MGIQESFPSGGLGDASTDILHSYFVYLIAEANLGSVADEFFLS